METKMFTAGGAAHITQKIREAVENGTREVTVRGAWEIENEIRLPSDLTLILENCHLRMKDGTYANMFVNENHGTALGKTVAGTDRNIRILGRGEAILDGGKYNGLSERNAGRDGNPPIWKNNLLLFTNVDGFRVEGLRCQNQRWWALNFIFCGNGYIGSIDFLSCDVAVDPHGNEYRGMRHDAGADVLVKNADGVDLRVGCHDITVENITGFVGDDSVAMTALFGGMEQAFAVEGLPIDLCRITVRNIRTAAFMSNVRLLCQGGTRLHDILVDGVVDRGRESPHMDTGIYAVNLGDTRLYGARHATEDEVYNITLKNIHGCGWATLALRGAVKNLVLEGITAGEGTPPILDERTV